MDEPRNFSRTFRSDALVFSEVLYSFLGEMDLLEPG